jgi:hypothetical protein
VRLGGGPWDVTFGLHCQARQVPGLRVRATSSLQRGFALCVQDRIESSSKRRCNDFLSVIHFPPQWPGSVGFGTGKMLGTQFSGRLPVAPTLGGEAVLGDKG